MASHVSQQMAEGCLSRALPVPQVCYWAFQPSFSQPGLSKWCVGSVFLLSYSLTLLIVGCQAVSSAQVLGVAVAWLELWAPALQLLPSTTLHYYRCKRLADECGVEGKMARAQGAQRKAVEESVGGQRSQPDLHYSVFQGLKFWLAWCMRYLLGGGRHYK